MGRRKSKRRGNNEVLPAIAEPEERVPRRLRVEGELHQALAVALRELRDPRVAAVHVTRVQMTDDLQLARIYVRHGGLLPAVAEDDAKRRELMLGLRAASTRLRRRVGGQLALRYTPELRFMYDEGLDAAARVDELLAEIEREDADRQPPEAEEGSDEDQSDEEMV
jgi:ribosome-binding factor A